MITLLITFLLNMGILLSEQDYYDASSHQQETYQQMYEQDSAPIIDDDSDLQ